MVPSNDTSLPSSQPPKLFRDTYRSMYGLLQRGYMTLDSRLRNLSKGASSEDTYELFEEWCKEHGKTYPSAAEKRYRFEVFQESYARVTRHNQMGNSSYRAGLNYFSDRRDDEVPRCHLSEEHMNALDSVNRNANSSEMKKKAYDGMYGLLQRGYMTLDSRLRNLSKGASSEDTYELFEEWCKEHGKTYPSAAEKRYRFEVFQESYARVTRHNQMGNSSYRAGLNYFSDRRDDEVPRCHLSEEHMNALDSVNRNANSSEMKKKAYDGMYGLLQRGYMTLDSRLRNIYKGASSEDTYELFEEWCKEHGKTYPSAAEKRYRFEVFQESYARVTRHNQMGNSSYRAGLNYFSDRRDDEVPRGGFPKST